MDAFFKVLGWMGQGFYFARFLVQWLASEKAKKIVVPTIFWWLSLAGGVLAVTYAAYQREPVMLAGAAIPLFIYPRNLILLRFGKPLRGGLLVAIGLGLVCCLALFWTLELSQRFRGLPPLWQAVGGLGQGLWVSRFPVQWWISERRGESTLPTAFFGISLGGSVLLLAYASWKGDPIFIAGQILTPFLNARSLLLSLRAGGSFHRQDSGPKL